ncbi:MAG: primary-amine oxidase, partial [Acidimicrobiales bacterium]|nr:primary-amine oxidase [Acidimicrobiales bacterium]
MAARTHPLEPLTADEIAAAVAAARGTGRLDDAARFASVTLVEPTKVELASFADGVDVERLVRLSLVTGPEAAVTEAIVALPAGELRDWRVLDDVRPGLLFEESLLAIIALYDHPEWVAALAKRGITNLEKVQIDPWPTGSFGIAAEEGRRVVRCIAYYREDPEANGYARPIEGLLARVDMARSEVLDVIDLGVVPLPPELGSYYPEHNEPHRTDLKPLHITQPEGPSFTVEGNLVRWQRWSLRVALDPHEGLVLHTV